MCIRSNLGVVLPLSVCKVGHLVVSLGQSGDVDILLTLERHGSVWFAGLQYLNQHTEPKQTH